MYKVVDHKFMHMVFFFILFSLFVFLTKLLKNLFTHLGVATLCRRNFIYTQGGATLCLTEANVPSEILEKRCIREGI